MAKDKDFDKVLEKLNTITVWTINVNKRLDNLETRISNLEQSQVNYHNHLNNRFNGMAKFLAEFKRSVLM